MQDNEFIISGYRIRFNTTRKIIKSLFMLHNESVNVWSHLFGVTLFICLIFYTVVYLAPPGTLLNVKPVSLTQKWIGDTLIVREKNS